MSLWGDCDSAIRASVFDGLTDAEGCGFVWCVFVEIDDRFVATVRQMQAEGLVVVDPADDPAEGVQAIRRAVAQVVGRA